MRRFPRLDLCFNFASQLLLNLASTDADGAEELNGEPLMYLLRCHRIHHVAPELVALFIAKVGGGEQHKIAPGRLVRGARWSR